MVQAYCSGYYFKVLKKPVLRYIPHVLENGPIFQLEVVPRRGIVLVAVHLYLNYTVSFNMYTSHSCSVILHTG